MPRKSKVGKMSHAKIFLQSAEHRGILALAQNLAKESDYESRLSTRTRVTTKRRQQS